MLGDWPGAAVVEVRSSWLMDHQAAAVADAVEAVEAVQRVETAELAPAAAAAVVVVVVVTVAGLAADYQQHQALFQGCLEPGQSGLASDLAACCSAVHSAVVAAYLAVVVGAVVVVVVVVVVAAAAVAGVEAADEECLAVVDVVAPVPDEGGAVDEVWLVEDSAVEWHGRVGRVDRVDLGLVRPELVGIRRAGVPADSVSARVVSLASDRQQWQE
jgi:hypothetical protein